MKALLGYKARALLSNKDFMRAMHHMKSTNDRISSDGKSYKVVAIKHRSPHERA